MDKIVADSSPGYKTSLAALCRTQFPQFCRNCQFSYLYCNSRAILMPNRINELDALTPPNLHFFACKLAKYSPLPWSTTPHRALLATRRMPQGPDFRSWEGSAIGHRTAPLLRHLDLIEQVGMAIQHFEQLDQCQRRLGLAVLVAGEGMTAAVAEREQRPECRRPTP